jgi:flagellar biosynthesis/type III secretory pathway protein FliH
MYEEAMAEIREEIRQQAKEEFLQQGKQKGREEGREEATRLIENVFQVRFGEIDEKLAAIIPSIMRRSSEEFTPLLLQLSREELIDRFLESEE